MCDSNAALQQPIVFLIGNDTLGWPRVSFSGDSRDPYLTLRSSGTAYGNFSLEMDSRFRGNGNQNHTDPPDRSTRSIPAEAGIQKKDLTR